MIAVATLVVITRGQHNQEREPSNLGVTSVKEGVMTEMQRRHSKLYENRRSRKLGDRSNATELVVTTPWGDDDAYKTFDEFLRVSACSADAVVVGTVKNNISQLTADGTFIFTDSEIALEDVLKNTAGAKIEPANPLLITRPGGAVELNGTLLRVTDRSFKPLQINGRYLFFLRFVAATGAYQQLNGKSAFQLRENRISKLTEEEFSFPFAAAEISPTALVVLVRTIGTHCENNQKRGVK